MTCFGKKEKKKNEYQAYTLTELGYEKLSQALKSKRKYSKKLKNDMYIYTYIFFFGKEKDFF